MAAYIARRLLILPVQLLILSAIAFGVTRLAPGDPAITRMGEAASERDLAILREELGLTKPLYIQYGRWLEEIGTLSFGRSFTSGQPVADIIRAKLGPTLLLTTTALGIAVTLGITLGVIAAWRRNSGVDYSVTFASFFFISIPSFWSGIVAIMIFAVYLGWLPATGMSTPGQSSGWVDVAKHLILPATILGLDGMAAIARYTRSSLIDVFVQDYVQTARSKGLTEWAVVRRHALKNALLPVVTILGLRLPGLVGGSVLVETVFSWPGLGSAAVQAAFQRDYPVTMALVMVVGFLTVVGSLLADISYGLLDPRIRQ